jgi:hypothetical protein
VAGSIVATPRTPGRVAAEPLTHPQGGAGTPAALYDVAVYDAATYDDPGAPGGTQYGTTAAGRRAVGTITRG